MNHCQQLGKPLSIFERGCSRVRDSRLHQQRVRCRLPPTNRTTNNYFVPFLFFLFYLRKIMMHYGNEHYLWNIKTRINFLGTILIKRIDEITSLFHFFAIFTEILKSFYILLWLLPSWWLLIGKERERVVHIDTCNEEAEPKSCYFWSKYFGVLTQWYLKRDYYLVANWFQRWKHWIA